MQQLRLSGVDESGEHLVLVGADGQEFSVALDERLRASVRPAVRASRPGSDTLSPREVQSLIRAGQSVDEVADSTGWPRERVERFEAPIVAERVHVAGQARQSHVRGRGPDGQVQSLEARVAERLTARGVDPDLASWDSIRPEGGQWTVLVAFVAGQRSRRASWRYDPATRSVDALDDEARWLSEDELALPGGAAANALLGGGESSGAEGSDLMTSMREHSRVRARRGSRSRAGRGDEAAPVEADAAGGSPGAEAGAGRSAAPTAPVQAKASGIDSPSPSTDPAAVPGLAQMPDDVLPLEDLHYDPASMGPPPGARGDLPAPADDAAAEAGGAVVADAVGTPDDGETPETAADDERHAETTMARTGRMSRRMRRRQTNATLEDFFGDEESDDDAASDEESDDEHAELELLTDDDLDTDDVLPEETSEHEDDRAGAHEQDDELEHLDDARDHVPSDQSSEESDVDDSEVDDADDADDDAEVDGSEIDDAEPDVPEPATEPEPAAEPSGAPAAAAEPDDSAKRKGRTSVPSWDDIMFGAKDRRG